jgi:hypothetical protein
LRIDETSLKNALKMKKTMMLTTCIVSGLFVYSQGRVGINTINPRAMLDVKDSSVVFTGTFGLPASPDDPPVSASGVRMMWYPQKAAFRSGYVGNHNWNKDSIGDFSFATGFDSKAKGLVSTAFGYSTHATGYSSTALGSLTSASGEVSTAIGYYSRAPGHYSISMGFASEASGPLSVALGEYNIASGSRSMALGATTKATGDYSLAMGSGTIASGYNATAIGDHTESVGNSTIAMGAYTYAKSFNSFVFGRYNDTTNSSSQSWIDTEPLFVLGNGSFPNDRSNAVTVLKNAKTGINTVSPAAMLHIVRNAPSGGPLHANAHAIFESNLTSFIQLSNADNLQTGILSGNEATSIRSALIFLADSSLAIRSGGNNTRFTITKDGDLTKPATGSANMIPICYGSVSSTGVFNSGTSNFTVSNPSAGQYNISINGESYSSTTYVANVTVVNSSSPRMATTVAVGGDLIVKIWDDTGALVNSAFHFVIYKQ